MRLLIVPLFLIAEIALSISIANEIGALATVVWLIVAVVVGVNLLRHQGPASMMRAAQEARMGGRPEAPLLDGLVNSVAAILLITPGFLSDIIALLLLIKPLRRLAFGRLLARAMAGSSGFAAGFRHTQAGNVYEHQGDPRTKNATGHIIEQLPQDSSGSDQPPRR